MFTKVSFTLVTLLFLTARGEPDPQTFIASTPGPRLASPSQQPQYEEKDVVVYLTPEQISALQTGRGVLEPVLESQSQQADEQEDQEQISEYELEQGVDQQNDFLANQRFVIVQNQEDTETTPVKESNQEEPRGLSRFSSGSSRYKSSNFENNKYYAPTQKLLEYNRFLTPSTEKPEGRKSSVASSKKPERLDRKSYNYYSEYNQTNGDNINVKIIHPDAKLSDFLGLKKLEPQNAPVLYKKYKFVPYAYANKKQSDVAAIEEQNQRDRTLQKSNGRQFAILYTPAQSQDTQVSQENDQEDSRENEQNEDEELNESYNESKENERKKILDLLKKQNAQTEAANIAKRPVVIKKVSVTKQAPVPQPYIVRVSQNVAVKVPQPFEFIRQVSAETESNEKETERQNSKLEKPVRVPATRKVYVKVDKPILVERIVPVESRRDVQLTPQKLRIQGRTFKLYN